MAKTLDEAGVKRLIQEIKGANKNLNTPIPISTENTPESMAQNVKNIADYVEKAKAAGIANVDGMGVTCLIDGGCSGVGYLYVYSANEITIQGVLIKDDLVENMCFNIYTDGSYNEKALIVADNNKAVVTSDMLDEGARKPIILTPSTTEVDEETYQKLSQKGTDVILDLGDGNGSFIGLQGIFNTGDTLILMFGYSDFVESNGTIATFTISISTSAPHTLTLAATGACNPVPKSELTPVLQEIDLTGTDADRKAKLDQFETDWKALTGANDILGARFVGDMGTPSGELSTIFAWNSTSSLYEGVGTDDVEKIYKIQVDPSDGSIYITLLFSHLEAITIKTGNTPDDKEANVAAIDAYVDNLIALGVDMTKGYMIPIRTSSLENIVGFIIPNMKDTGYVGLGEIANGHGTNLYIANDGTFYNYALQDQRDNNLTTTSKFIVPAINEINANAVHSDKLVPTIEAITIRTGNTPGEKAANVAAIKAYVDNLKSLGVDITKGYGILCKYNDNGYIGICFPSETNSFRLCGIKPVDTTRGVFVIIESDGTYKTEEIITFNKKLSSLTTTSKFLVPAINEVNALVEKKADKSLNAKSLEAITIKIGSAPENKAANKAVIEAYRDNLTALGVDVTKGFMIPVKTENGNGFILFNGTKGEGYVKINNDCYGISIAADYGCSPINLMSTSTSHGTLETTSKRVLPAINEVNALAKGYSALLTPIELTTETAQNKTAIDARVAAFTAQGISLTNGCCIPVTYKGVYAGNISLINGDWYGLLVKNTNNPADNVNIKLSADGTITEGNSAQ